MPNPVPATALPLRVRPLVWRTRDIYSALVIAAICLGIGFTQNDLFVWLALAAALPAIVVYSAFRSFVEVSDERVTVRDVAGRGRWVRREKVTAIHVRSFWIVMADAADRELLRIRPLYTREQIEAIGTALSVPVDRDKRRA